MTKLEINSSVTEDSTTVKLKYDSSDIGTIRDIPANQVKYYYLKYYIDHIFSF